MIAWTQWQPLRSEQAATAGFITLANYNPFSGHPGAQCALLAAARAPSWPRSRATRSTSRRSPCSAQNYVDLGENRLAQATFEHEVELQPSNAQSWRDLANYYQGLPGRAASDAATARTPRRSTSTRRDARR